MFRFLPLIAVVAATLALVATPADQPILGLPHGEFAKLAYGVSLLLWLVMGLARRAGAAALSRVVGGALTWTFFLILLVGLYAYRFEFSDLADRIIAEFSPTEPQIGAGGEVVVNRRLGGEFVVAGKINRAPVTLLFDTGASSVVLRAEDARKAGVDLSDLSYDVEVTTANGSALAAETRLDEVAIGPIVERNVRALVAKPGALSESLLGMSFLEKLKSYTVERGRLVLRGG